MRAVISLNQALSGFDAARAIGAEAGMAAIVKKNDVSVSSIAIDPLTCMVLNRVGGGSPPIEAGHIPHDRFESELAGGTEHCRPPGAKGRPKEFRPDSRGIGNHLRTIG